MTFLPSLDIMLAFTAASLLLILTPGPDMTLFLSQTLTGGRARGFAAMGGAYVGIVIHTTLAAFGLSALLAASATAFMIVKLVGIGYLLWLAFDAIRHGSALTLRNETGPPRPLSQIFLMGIGVDLLNPKVVMFFVTFLPQFVSATDPNAGAKMFFLGMFYNMLGLPASAALIFTAERFTAAIRRSPRVMRVIDYSFAGLMGAFAARLFFTRAN